MKGSACRAHRFPAMFRPLMICASGARWYVLPEIMHLVLCVTLAGAVEFVETRQWGRQKPDRRAQPLALRARHSLAWQAERCGECA